MWQIVFHKEERWQQSSSFIHGWSKLLYKPRWGKLHSKNPRAISCWPKPDGEIRFTKAGRMCLQRCGPLRVGRMPQDDTCISGTHRYAMYAIVCISSASKEFWSNVQKCWLAFAAEPFSVESVETCSNETHVLFQIMALVRKTPGSPIASDAASFYLWCRMHHRPTIAWYHVLCVLGTFVAASRTGLLEAWLKAACRGHSQCRCCTEAFPCAPAPRIRDWAVAGSSRGMAKLAYTHNSF